MSPHPSACRPERKSRTSCRGAVWYRACRMSFVAEAEQIVDAPAPRVFDQLANFASWPSWMPRSFVPVVRAGAPSPLRLGDRFRVKVGGAPVASTLKISRLDRPRELAWRGGVRGLLWAEHRFLLEPEGESRTRVRSVETWHGPLAAILRRVIEPTAVKIGGQQLDLARAATTTAH